MPALSTGEKAEGVALVGKEGVLNWKYRVRGRRGHGGNEGKDMQEKGTRREGVKRAQTLVLTLFVVHI